MFTPPYLFSYSLTISLIRQIIYEKKSLTIINQYYEPIFTNIHNAVCDVFCYCSNGSTLTDRNGNRRTW